MTLTATLLAALVALQAATLAQLHRMARDSSGRYAAALEELDSAERALAELRA